MAMIRTLITGGISPDFEEILADHGGMSPGDGSNLENRDRARLSLISLNDERFTLRGVRKFSIK